MKSKKTVDWRMGRRALCCAAVVSISCASGAGSTEPTGRSWQALYAGQITMFGPVLQQVAQTSFSVLYMAWGGGCSNTVATCILSPHTLHYRPHGDTNPADEKTVVWDGGGGFTGFVPSDIHAGDGSVDCQKPGESGQFCGTSTTFWDPVSGVNPSTLNAVHPSGQSTYKVIAATGLTAATAYDWWITIGDGSDADDGQLWQGVTSGQQTVTTALPTNSTAGFHFTFSADQQENTSYDGSSDDQQRGGGQWRVGVMSAIQNVSKPDFMLGGGDLTLNGGGMKLVRHWFLDDTTNSPIPTNLLANTPFFTAMGNHDWFTSGSLDHFDCCQDGWGAPKPRDMQLIPLASLLYGYATPNYSFITEGPGHGPYYASGAPYYSFDWGNSHFIVLSSGTDNEGSLSNVEIDGGDCMAFSHSAWTGIWADQFAWLQTDLRNHQKGNSLTNTEHIFVAMHDPVFHSSGDSAFPVNWQPRLDGWGNPTLPYNSPPPQWPPNTPEPATVAYQGTSTVTPCFNGPTYTEFASKYGTHQLTDLFQTYNVDIVLGGHVHTYSRAQDGSVWYITAGIGGGGQDDSNQHSVDNKSRAGYTIANGQPLDPPHPDNGKGSIQFPQSFGSNQSGTAHGSVSWNTPAYAMAMWGYVDVHVLGDEVTVNTQMVQPLYNQNGFAPSNGPTLPVTSVTDVDDLVLGANPPTNFNVALGSGPVTSSGGPVHITWSVTSMSAGTSHLFASSDGGVTFPEYSCLPQGLAFGTGTTQLSCDYAMAPGQVAYFYANDQATGATSSNSQTVSFVFPACTLNDTVALTKTNNAVTVNWGSGSGYECPPVTFQDFAVQRQDNDPQTGLPFWNTIATTTGKQFIDTGYNCKTTTSYQVVAMTTNASGLIVPSLPTPPATILSPSMSCVPTALTATQGQGLANNSVLLNWTNDFDEGSYTALSLARTTGPSCSGTAAITPLSTSNTSYSDLSTVPGTTYCYTLQATNGAGANSSNAVVITIPSIGAPHLHASPNKDVGTSIVSWSFDPNNPATATTIYKFNPSIQADPKTWSPLITLPNSQPSGGTNVYYDAQDGSAGSTWSYVAIGLTTTKAVDANWHLTAAAGVSPNSNVATVTLPSTSSGRVPIVVEKETAHSSA